MSRTAGNNKVMEKVAGGFGAGQSPDPSNDNDIINDQPSDSVDNDKSGSKAQAQPTADTSIKDSRRKLGKISEQISNTGAGAVIDITIDESESDEEAEELPLFTFGKTEERHTQKNNDEGNDTDREHEDGEDEDDQDR